jgi:hypothetical protein
MYLLQLDNITGLLKADLDLDNWMAIEAFRDLFNKDGYGLRALTCVALVMDYGSIIKNYSEKERPLKAMEIVFNDRKAINWNIDEVQIACIAYKNFQYNPSLEEKALLDELKVTKLNEIKEAESTFQKTVLLKELSGINDLCESFEKKNLGKDAFAESPVRNNYSLLRLEIKIIDPKSFYYERQKRESERERQKLERESSSSDSEGNVSTATITSTNTESARIGKNVARNVETSSGKSTSGRGKKTTSRKVQGPRSGTSIPKPPNIGIPPPPKQ